MGYLKFSQTADKTIANTTTETSLFGTGVGSLTIPANFWIVGRNVEIKLCGDFSDTGNPTGDVKVKLGSVTVSDSTPTSFSSLTGTEQWDIIIELTCRSTGVTGSVETTVIFEYETTTGSTPVERFDISGTNTVIDTTISSTIDVTFQWGTANASNTLTSQIGSVKVLG